ncbi:hypothetical protein MKW98_024854, partial [Papaver atlanticum]
WGSPSGNVLDALSGDFMKPRINEVDELLKNGVNVTMYNGQEACHWLQEHRHEFKKEVYGLVLLEVDKLKVLSESLASSTSKAEKCSSEHRYCVCL